jgi:hypothetical protein
LGRETWQGQLSCITSFYRAVVGMDTSLLKVKKVSILPTDSVFVSYHPPKDGEYSNIEVPTRCTCYRVYFSLTIALHVSGITITHLQEHKATVTTASGNRYTVIDRVKFTDKEYI